MPRYACCAAQCACRVGRQHGAACCSLRLCICPVSQDINTLSAAALGDFVDARNALDEFSDAAIAGGNAAVLVRDTVAPLAVQLDTSLLLWLTRSNAVKEN